MLGRKSQFETLMEAINGVNAKVDNLQVEIDTLKASAKQTKKPVAKKAPKGKQSKASKELEAMIIADRKEYGKKLVKSCKKTTAPKTTKKSAKKSAPATRSEALEAKYGDFDTRKAYVELRNKVAEEFKALAEEHEVYIRSKKTYVKVLKETTDALNGKKFNKAVVKKAFLAAAK